MLRKVMVRPWLRVFHLLPQNPELYPHLSPIEADANAHPLDPVPCHRRWLKLRSMLYQRLRHGIPSTREP